MAAMTLNAYALAQGWAPKDLLPSRISAKERADERRTLRDNRILRDAAGQVVPFDREDMRNTTNLTGAGMYYSPETMTWHPHRGILQVLLAWGVATIQ